MSLLDPGVVERGVVPVQQLCNLCGSDQFSLVSNLDRRKKYLKTVICQGCGLVFTAKNVIADLKQFYTADYRGNRIKPPLKHVFRHGKNALRRYAKLKQYLQPGQSLLDIGSGHGEFVYLMSYLGYRAKGTEPHQGCANYCHSHLGLQIENKFLEDFAAVTHETFDVVTIFHVLEHKEDPLKTLQIIYQLLNTDGLCVVEVPNISSYCTTPKNLFHIDHLFNFNNETLSRLGQKAGFTVVSALHAWNQENITVIFRKNSGQAHSPVISSRAPKNYQKLYNKLRHYTNIVHYCTPMPYWRLIKKGIRYLQERQYAKRFADAKTLLDNLYQTVR